MAKQIPTYTIDIDPALRTPLRVKVAQENTTIKIWVSDLIRKAIEEDCDCCKEKAA